MKSIPFAFIRSTVLIVLVCCIAGSSPPAAADTDTPVFVAPGCQAAPVSSHCMHERREGLPVPLFLNQSDHWLLDSYRVVAEADYYASDVRNFSVNVWTHYQFSPVAGNVGGKLDLAVPITPHALYGANNEFLDPVVWFDGGELPYDIAINRDVMKIRDDAKVWYKKRIINEAIHPRLENASDLRAVAPHLAAAGYDVVLLVSPIIVSGAPNHLVIGYTSNTNVDSTCCKGVSIPATSADPYMFLFDLSNTRYWQGQRFGEIELIDGFEGAFAAVPDHLMLEDVSPRRSLLRGTGTIERDLVIPVQPNRFVVEPRRWPMDLPDSTVDFQLERPTGLHADVRIDEIQASPDIEVFAFLPILLTDSDPVAVFTARQTGARVVGPSFIDVTGRVVDPGTPSVSDVETYRIVAKGPAISGHDLAVGPLSRVTDPQISGIPNATSFHARVANHGLFAEDVIATVYVNHKFVRTYAFGRIGPNEERDLIIPDVRPWRYPCVVEIEIDPVGGESDRTNNRSMLILPANARF